MKTIEVTDMPKYINASPICMNLLFIGDTGIGKTTVVENMCKESNSYLKTLILSQLDPSEALGIPVKREMEYNGHAISVLDTAIPKWVFDLLEHKDENPILFLDEFLCAKPGVMNSFLNFLTQKRVGPIDLSFVRVVAATNIGHYTYDPDNNILSRFCMFYTVNTSAGSYVNDYRIDYHYEDINEHAGVIFDTRSLKPRCYEQLSKVTDNNLYYDFYEGFTNTEYVFVYPDKKFNDIFREYVEKVPGKSEFTISASNAKCVAAILKSTNPKLRNWNPVCDKITNMTPEAVKLIRAALSPNVAKKVSGVDIDKEDNNIDTDK